MGSFYHFVSLIFFFSFFSLQPRKDRRRSWSSIWLGDSAPESSEGILPKGFRYDRGSVPGQLSYAYWSLNISSSSRSVRYLTLKSSSKSPFLQQLLSTPSLLPTRPDRLKRRRK
jgi:hypothetical protein